MAQKDDTTGTQPTTAPGSGSWVNPAIRAENQRYLAQQQQLQAQQPHPGYPQAAVHALEAAHHPAPEQQTAAPMPRYYRAPWHKPAFSATRRFICVFLAILTLASGLAGALAHWANTTLINTQNFTALTQTIAADEEFKTNLSAGMTEDIMGSAAVATYLGDGNSTAWYGGVQNWLYDQTESLVASSTTATVTSDAYPELIQQVIADTHAYNFAGESRPAVLDLSALYEAAETSVNGAVPLTVETENLPGRTITLDTGNSVYPINSAINSLMTFAGAWKMLLALSGVSALLGFLSWPGHRFAYLAVVAYLGAGALWVASLVGGGLSLTSGLTLPASTTAVIFVQKLSETLTGSYADYHAQLAGNMLVAAAVLTLIALLVGILRLTARATTAHTR